MMLTERQNLILEKIIRDYINLAKPISSDFLVGRHHLDLSPATLRIEMQNLTDKGYLYQPHTSAGRVPTDKGYRFFVDVLIKRGFDELNNKEFIKEIEELEERMEDSFRFFREMTKTLACFSSNLTLGYSADDKFFLKEGWAEISKEPEFENVDFVKSLVEMIDNFEKKIEDFDFDFEKPEVFIGRENPIVKNTQFSMILAPVKFPKKKKGAVAILGPKRMEYQKNISLANALIKLLEDF